MRNGSAPPVSSGPVPFHWCDSIAATPESGYTALMPPLPSAAGSMFMAVLNSSRKRRVIFQKRSWSPRFGKMGPEIGSQNSVSRISTCNRNTSMSWLESAG